MRLCDGCEMARRLATWKDETQLYDMRWELGSVSIGVADLNCLTALALS